MAPATARKKIHTRHMTSRAPDHRFMASLTLPFFHPLCSAPFSAAFQTHRSDPASGPLHLLPLALPGYLSPRWPHGRLLPPHPSPLMSLAFPDWPPYGNSLDPPHCSLPPPFWSPASAPPEGSLHRDPSPARSLHCLRATSAPLIVAERGEVCLAPGGGGQDALTQPQEWPLGRPSPQAGQDGRSRL